MQQEPAFEQILAYLEGELPEAERQQVEAWIKENPEALNVLSETDEVLTLLKAEHLDHMRTQVAAWESVYQTDKQETTTPAKTRPFVRFYKYAAAAVVLVALMLGFLYVNNRPLSAADAFAASFSPQQDPLLMGLRTRNAGDASQYSSHQAYLALSSGNCKTLDQNIQSYTFADAAERFYIQGLAKLCAGDAAGAKSIFAQLRGLDHRWYNEGADWYLALCELKLGRVDACTTQLKAIAKNNTHHFYDDAIALMDSL